MRVLCLMSGDGVDQDMGKAVKWLLASAAQGYAEAQTVLGYCYEEGKGVTEDEHKAVECYRAAAEQGYSVSQFALGMCYDQGKGVDEDDDEAVKWYRAAAKQDCAQAQHALGVCYRSGQGVDEDNDQAVKLFCAAAEQGYAPAQCALGDCYENGYGVGKDLVMSAQWYCKAVAQGDDDAMAALGTLAARTSDLRVLFVLGGAQGLPSELDVPLERARSVYCNSSDRARQAALCWMLIAGLLLPQKDVTMLIARAVYETRSDPATWERWQPACFSPPTREGLDREGSHRQSLSSSFERDLELRERMESSPLDERADWSTSAESSEASSNVPVELPAPMTVLLQGGALTDGGVSDPLLKDKNPEEAFLAALSEHRLLSFMEAQVPRGEWATKMDEANRTLLHYACATGDMAAVKALLTCGANANARDGVGLRPAHFAAGRGHKDILQMLISAGADWVSKSDVHFTPFDSAIMSVQTAKGSVETERCADCVRLLLEKGSRLESVHASIHTLIQPWMRTFEASCARIIMEQKDSSGEDADSDEYDSNEEESY